MKTILKDKLFLFLTLAASLSTLAALPYILSLIPPGQEPMPLPLPLIIAISFVQSTIYYGLMVFAGLKIYKGLGFELPALQKWKEGDSVRSTLINIFSTAPFFGILSFGAILIGDYIFELLGSSLTIFTAQEPVWWKSLLASFYGGIAEEIIVRFFMMTGIVWVLSKIFKINSPQTHNNIVIIAIILAAVLFGTLHLPATAQLTTLTPLVVSRAILLNGIPGVIFGILYWRKGLEYAIVAHFTADIFLHVLFPFFL